MEQPRPQNIEHNEMQSALQELDRNIVGRTVKTDALLQFIESGNAIIESNVTGGAILSIVTSKGIFHAPNMVYLKKLALQIKNSKGGDFYKKVKRFANENLRDGIFSMRFKKPSSYYPQWDELLEYVVDNNGELPPVVPIEPDYKYLNEEQKNELKKQSVSFSELQPVVGQMKEFVANIEKGELNLAIAGIERMLNYSDSAKLKTIFETSLLVDVISKLCEKTNTTVDTPRGKVDTVMRILDLMHHIDSLNTLHFERNDSQKLYQSVANIFANSIRANIARVEDVNFKKDYQGKFAEAKQKITEMKKNGLYGQESTFLPNDIVEFFEGKNNSEPVVEVPSNIVNEVLDENFVVPQAEVTTEPAEISVNLENDERPQEVVIEIPVTENPSMTGGNNAEVPQVAPVVEPEIATPENEQEVPPSELDQKLAQRLAGIKDELFAVIAKEDDKQVIEDAISNPDEQNWMSFEFDVFSEYLKNDALSPGLKQELVNIILEYRENKTDMLSAIEYLNALSILKDNVAIQLPPNYLQIAEQKMQKIRSGDSKINVNEKARIENIYNQLTGSNAVSENRPDSSEVIVDVVVSANNPVATNPTAPEVNPAETVEQKVKSLENIANSLVSMEGIKHVAKVYKKELENILDRFESSTTDDQGYIKDIKGFSFDVREALGVPLLDKAAPAEIQSMVRHMWTALSVCLHSAITLVRKTRNEEVLEVENSVGHDADDQDEVAPPDVEGSATVSVVNNPVEEQELQEVSAENKEKYNEVKKKNVKTPEEKQEEAQKALKAVQGVSSIQEFLGKEKRTVREVFDFIHSMAVVNSYNDFDLKSESFKLFGVRVTSASQKITTLNKAIETAYSYLRGKGVSIKNPRYGIRFIKNK